MPKRILITGTSGFVAHHIVEHFLKNTDFEIIGIDRLDYASEGYDRLRDIEVFNENRVRLYEWDLNTPLSEGLKKEIGEINYIIHAAAGSHVDRSILNPLEFINNNTQSTLNMLEYTRELLKRNCLEKFVYFSTDEVYGTAPEGVDYKEGERFNPGNPYSASKAASECICYAYSNTYKIPIIITNTMNVIGERQNPEKYLPKIINSILDNETLQIHGNREKTKAGKRHYIHARTVADAILFILNKTTELLDNNDASLGKFNIVGEREYDNLELAQEVAKHMGKELKYELVDFHSSRPGHDLRYSLSGEKLKKMGWIHPLNIEKSIKKTIDWSLDPKNIRWLGRKAQKN
jgi:dTDP-glucose 4,6-dehydratase